MIRRTVALLALVVASFAMSACADVTGPDSTKSDCGVVIGPWTNSCQPTGG
jgi:hypothetical protein